MKITLGFSPCPNDTFIFDALVNGGFETEGVEFNTMLEDVETLNEWALQGKLDITKLSFPAFFKAKDQYRLLNSGSALGKGVGPLLISNRPENFSEKDIEDATVILPGINTTAHLLFSFAYPNAKKKIFRVFNEIEDALVAGEADLGVIIHENRFTYQDKGLFKVKDLGEFWEQKMEVPIPLGGIVIKKELAEDLYTKMNEWIHHSLCVAYTKHPEISEYVKKHSQTMSEEVMLQHIKLYVNRFSLDLGKEGRNAIETLEKVYQRIQEVELA